MDNVIFLILGILIGYGLAYFCVRSINASLIDLRKKYEVIIDILSRWQNNTVRK